MTFSLCLRLDIARFKKWFSPFACFVKKTDFQFMKVINKVDNSNNNGSVNNDYDVKDYGDNYGDSYSNHHEI